MIQAVREGVLPRWSMPRSMGELGVSGFVVLCQVNTENDQKLVGLIGRSDRLVLDWEVADGAM